MIEPVESQAFTLLVTILTGVVVGVFFDLYRVARSSLGFGPAATAVGDIAFSLFATTVAFTFLLATSKGEVRLFMFFGFGTGFAAYRVLLGRRVVGGAVLVVDVFRRARRATRLGTREASFRLRRVAMKARRKMAARRRAGELVARMLGGPIGLLCPRKRT